MVDDLRVCLVGVDKERNEVMSGSGDCVTSNMVQPHGARHTGIGRRYAQLGHNRRQDTIGSFVV